MTKKAEVIDFRFEGPLDERIARMLRFCTNEDGSLNREKIAEYQQDLMDRVCEPSDEFKQLLREVFAAGETDD